MHKYLLLHLHFYLSFVLSLYKEKCIKLRYLTWKNIYRQYGGGAWTKEFWVVVTDEKMRRKKNKTSTHYSFWADVQFVFGIEAVKMKTERKEKNGIWQTEKDIFL